MTLLISNFIMFMCQVPKLASTLKCPRSLDWASHAQKRTFELHTQNVYLYFSFMLVVFKVNISKLFLCVLFKLG